MVDAERAHARLRRLETILDRLERVRALGEESYRADESARAATERWLQLAVQIRIDVAAQIVSERSLPPPTDHAGVFRALSGDLLEEDLTDRLASAARPRDLLVHAHLDIDDGAVFAALSRLDDLRAFAAAAGRAADES